MKTLCLISIIFAIGNFANGLLEYPEDGRWNNNTLERIVGGGGGGLRNIVTRTEASQLQQTELSLQDIKVALREENVQMIQRCELGNCGSGDVEVLTYYENHVLQKTVKLPVEERTETFASGGTPCKRSNPCPTFCRRSSNGQFFVAPRVCGTLLNANLRKRCFLCRRYVCRQGYISSK